MQFSTVKKRGRARRSGFTEAILSVGSLLVLACPSSSRSSMGSTETTVDLDRVTTLRIVGLDEARYQAQPPASDGETRTFTCILRPQAGMDEELHFHILTVDWTPAAPSGSETSPGSLRPNTGGPGGGFVSFEQATSDRKYIIGITEGLLLPDSVSTPELRLENIYHRLNAAYTAQRLSQVGRQR